MAAALLLGSMATAVAGEVTARRIIAADSEPGNWLAHGRSYDEQRHSPLTGITRENVGSLGYARRRTSVAPIVKACRFLHSANRRHRVTCALPGEPIEIRISPRWLRLRRSMIVGQSLRRLMLCAPRWK